MYNFHIGSIISAAAKCFLSEMGAAVVQAGKRPLLYSSLFAALPPLAFTSSGRMTLFHISLQFYAPHQPPNYQPPLPAVLLVITEEYLTMNTQLFTVKWVLLNEVRGLGRYSIGLIKELKL